MKQMPLSRSSATNRAGQSNQPSFTSLLYPISNSAEQSNYPFLPSAQSDRDLRFTSRSLLADSAAPYLAKVDVQI